MNPFHKHYFQFADTRQQHIVGGLITVAVLVTVFILLCANLFALTLPEGQGVRPGVYCKPKMTTVGSQDTTGPMTRDELKDLACLGFSADLVMQSFCHTSAYPKPVD